jgi:hypothetical protein
MKELTPFLTRSVVWSHLLDPCCRAMMHLACTSLAAYGFAATPRHGPVRASAAAAPAVNIPTFQSAGVNTELKLSLLSLAANLDRGQSYNPTSSDAYKERMSTATALVEALAAASPPLPTTLEALDGEWELVFTDVAHGIFRSSPFFLAIQQAYAKNADPPAPEKAELFFKLHELQTCSWGVSKIGRVAQTIDSSAGMLYSEFDTNLLSLTTIPIIGFWKLCAAAQSVLLNSGPECARPAHSPPYHARRSRRV